MAIFIPGHVQMFESVGLSLPLFGAIVNNLVFPLIELPYPVDNISIIPSLIFALELRVPELGLLWRLLGSIDFTIGLRYYD